VGYAAGWAVERDAVGRKIAIAIGCLALTAIGVYLAWPKHRIPTPNPDDYRRPWVCDACGHTWQAPPSQGLLACPKCGEKKGAQAAIFVCKACGKEFEAYRFADFYSLDGEVGPDGKPAVPATYYKKPGGAWTTDRSKIEPIVCPGCGNSDAAKLEEKVFAP